MQASEVTFFKLIEGEKQFQVPLYQRTYSWGQKECARLWEDVTEQADILASGETRTPHFIGSVVLAPGTVSAADMQRWLVVDGQQRMTTLMLACCALRDRLRGIAPREAERIHKQYLVNEYKEGPEHYRLLPTQVDRSSFTAVVDGDARAGGDDTIGTAYRYFKNALLDTDPKGDVEVLKRVEAVLRGRLSVVGITADATDNVYRIFESLNNTGVSLSQTDLLRNYVFMLLPTRGERVYEKIWLPMQDELGPANLELLAWLDLVIRGDHRAKQSEVYRAQQQRLDEVVGQGEEALETEIAELRRRGSLLMRILDPAREPDPALRAVLERLKEWGGQTAYPLALHLFDLLDHGRADAGQVTRALTYVESFLVRRMICQIPTNNLNRILNSAPRELEEDRPADEAVRRYLSAPRRYWATDEQLRAAIATKPFYWSGRAAQRVFVLKRLERGMGASEPVDFGTGKFTIEHVMPQTPTQEWLDLLAPEVTDEGGPAELHRAVLHVLGNLTLTADNSTLSNRPFERKQEIFDASALRLNREIADAPTWGKAEIQARGRALADRCVELWPAPLPGGADLADDRQEWKTLRRLLAELPAGRWTTYGDLAAVIGSHAAAIGTHLAGRPELENAHRVLTSEGQISSSFRWPDGRIASAREVLEEEGVAFSAAGRAAPEQRLSAAGLAALIGLGTGQDGSGDGEDGPDGEFERLLQRFADQLEPHGELIGETVERVLEHWTARGGSVDFGTAKSETSCFLWLDRPDKPGWIWPVVFYPRSAVVEVVFQHLSVRPPFDEAALREELRQRLNRIDGVDIPEAKLVLRPRFPVAALAGGGEAELLRTLDWFMERVGTAVPPEGGDGAVPEDGAVPAADAARPEPDGAVFDEALAAEFHNAMFLLYSRVKAETGHNAVALLKMSSGPASVAEARRALAAPRVSADFAVLRERGRLDLTVEAHVLEPRFAPLFTEAEIWTARQRLADEGAAY
ncbi:GmrSD restriction endonuclease domain-containing protein [Actinomadura parmotrematis]|uniref:GmrSD restriction endonuclease domain-containing protein n=1 Tax=Actinomadura parmotrematis TaxID=2864039 RepID=UPI00215D9A2E|nr:DUF262 domain-containing protein [Actinomadura parmotrematis]